jgi:hypothetical protein
MSLHAARGVEEGDRWDGNEAILRAMASAWTELTLFESHDVIRARYQQRHGWEISAAKTSEIAAFFSQGRQYFEAAAEAGPLVAPLLQYYGVNAVTRGSILFLGKHQRQSTLKPSHGIEVSNWQATLSHGVKAVADLRLLLNPTGTLAEFVRVSQGRTTLPVRTDDFQQTSITLRGSREVPSPVSVTLKEVLARMPDLQQLYSDIAGEPSSVFNVGIQQSAARDATHVAVFATRDHQLDQNALQSAAVQLATATVAPHHQPGDNREALRFSWSHAPGEAPADGFPPLKYDPPLTLLVLPFSHELDLSIAATLYLFSYAIGMLSRYFPQHWLAGLTGGRGDGLFPLVREGLRTLPTAFPIAVTGELSQA